VLARILALSIGSEVLYLVLAYRSHLPASAAPGLSWYHPDRFEESIAFVGVWSALFLLYALAIRAAAGRKRTVPFAVVFVTSAIFRASFFWTSALPTTTTEPPRAFLQADSPMSSAVTSLDELPLVQRLEARIGRTAVVRPAVSILFDLASLALAPGLLRALSLPEGLALVQGWNPLLVRESAGAPIEPIALFLLLLAFRLAQTSRRALGALAYGASLTGPLPLVATLPLLAKALGTRVVLALAVAGGAWGLLLRSSSWPDVLGWPPRDSVGGSLFPAVASLNRLFVSRDARVAVYMMGTLLLLVAGLETAKLGRSLADLPRRALVVIACFLFVSPQVMPSAFLSLATLAAYSDNRGYVVFTATAPLVYWGIDASGWNFWLAFTQYFPGYTSVLYTWLGRKKK
jgi:hypothetical protein